MYGNSHNQGTCVLLDVSTSLCTRRNEDISELKGVHIANVEVHHRSSSVEYCYIYCSISK